MAMVTVVHGLAGSVFSTFAKALVSSHFLAQGDFTTDQIVSETASKSGQTVESVGALAQQVIEVFVHLATAPASLSRSEAIKGKFKLDQSSENALLGVWTELGTDVQRAVASQRQWNASVRSCAWTIDVKMLGRRTEMLNEPECTVRVLTGDSTLQFSMDKTHLEDLVSQLESIETRTKDLVFKP